MIRTLDPATWKDRFPDEILTLGLALTLDRLLGEPPAAVHPVVGMGGLIQRLERKRPRGHPARELCWGGATALLVASAAGSGAVVAEAFARKLPPAVRILTEAILLKTLFACRALDRAALRCAASLERGDLARAREDLSWLVSRDRSHLSGTEVAGAAIESVAENASDSLTAPLLAYAVGRLPGAAIYRAINTLDAMVGYRGEYEYAGKIPARLDDLANGVPARITALLIALCSTRPVPAMCCVLQDRRRTESPNAGWPMAAMAGALGVNLSKWGPYTLKAYSLNENGRPPRSDDILTAVCWLRRTTLATAALTGGLLLVRRRVARKFRCPS